MENVLKVKNKDSRTTSSDVALVCFLLKLNICNTVVLHFVAELEPAIIH